MSQHLRPLMLRALITWAIGMVLWFSQENIRRALLPEQACFQALGSVLFPSYQLRSGEGSRAQAFQLARLADAPPSQPFLVNTTADTEKAFAAHPVSASDLAVLLHALHRNGVESVMLGAPHAWEDADPYAIDALEMVGQSFQRWITSSPVSRSASDSPMPAAFMRASIAAAQVKGNTSLWPIVNRASLPDCFLGKETSWAGFSQIESEDPSTGHVYLVARWDDRIIFSSALLALLAHENVQLDACEIIAGDSIRLPNHGKYIPLDQYGRIALKSEQSLPAADLLAEQLIRPEPAQLALLNKHSEPVHILDQSTERSPAHQQNQQLVHRALLTLHQTPRIDATIALPRLPAWGEILLLAAVAFQFVTIFSLDRKTQGIALLLLAVLALLAIRFGHTWLPLFPMLGMLGHAVLWRTPLRTQDQAKEKAEELTINYLPSDGPYVLDEPKIEPKVQSKPEPQKAVAKKTATNKKTATPAVTAPPEPEIPADPAPAAPEVTPAAAPKPKEPAAKKTAPPQKKAKKAARNRKKN